ncbi:DUF11 domain-containing protein [Actinophytocola sp.]|uniref:DUF11 domain-containing protein n=1 Tax=Actinophytocola sp. TaxID=1872138 RepID=UPI002ED9F677
MTTNAAAHAQQLSPFPCDSTYYMMQPGGNGRSVLGRIAFPTPGGGTDTSFQPIAEAQFRFNAIGYNHLDNLIYGVINGGAQIFRVDAAGSFQNLGAPLLNGRPIGGDGIISGAFRANGNFVFRDGGTAYAVDVGVTPPRVVASAALSRNAQFADWAVNPVDDAIYAFDRGINQVVRIALDGDGVADVVPAGGTLPAGAVVEGQGTTWIDGNGRITFLGGRDGGGHIDFYQAAFDPGAGTYASLRHIGTEPALAGSGDGANCAFRMAFEKNVAPTTVVAGQTVTYTYDLTNGTGQARTVTFTDDLRRPGAGGAFVPGSVRTPTGTVSLENGDRTVVIRGLTVAAGQHVRVSADVRVPPTFSGVLRNQAQLTGGGIPGGEVWSDYPGTPDPVDPTPLTVDPLDVDIAVTKNIGGQNENLVRPGETFDYSVVVTNNGSDPSWPVVLTDDVPAPLVPVAASDGGTTNGQRARWTIDTIAPGGVLTRNITVRVATDQAQTVVNTATAASADGVPDTNPGNDTSNEVRTNIEIPIPQADLRVAKSAPANADPGGALTYTITVDNLGPARSGGSTLTDTLPDGFTVTAVSGGGIVSGRTVVWQLAPLAAGATMPFQVSGTTPFGAARLVNEATMVPSQDGPIDPVPDNNTARVTTDVRAPAADLLLVKEGPESVRPGAQATYTVRVRNNGTDRSTGSTVRDTLPSGFTLVATPDGATVDGAVIVWTLGELTVGAERVLTYAVVAPVEGGTGTNTAVVTPIAGGPADPDPANNTDQVTTTAAPAADLAITKSGPDFVDAGGSFQWTIDVVNHGPSTARNVVVTDTVPAGFPVGAPTGPGAVTVLVNNDGTTTVRWAVGDLAPDATARFTVPVTAPAVAGSGRNSASVTSDTADPNGAPPPATHQVAVRGFTLAKTVRSAPASVRPGAEVVYEIVATNSGPVPYDDTRGLATFHDDLTDVLDDATLVSVTPGAGITSEDNGFTWTGPLAAGASTTMLVTVRVRPGGDGELRNTVRGGTNCGPGPSAPECAPTGIPVRALTLTKTVSATVVEPGDELTYRVVITNTGGYAFTGADPAVVTDDLSAVLDDATFGVASTTPAGRGSIVAPSAGSPTLRWSGPLDLGATVTLRYVLTVHDPQTGDGRLVNTVSSVDDPNCLPSNGCGPDEPTLLRAFVLAKSVDRAASEPVAPGDAVTYTITAVNSGQVPYDEATFAEDLTGVLDDAELVDVAADAGTVALADGSTVLSWSGPLPVADPPGTPGVTVTVTVRVLDPNLTGDHSLVNVVSGSVNCPGTEDPSAECTAGPPLPVLGLTVTKAADAAAVHAGATVRYTVTVTNTGQADYTADNPAVAVDDLTAVLDDAEYAGDSAVEGGGAVVFDAGKLTWTGSLAVGAVATITYGVTVASRGQGDHRLRNVVLAEDSNCVAAPNEPVPADERCGGRHDVLVAELAITKTADVSRVRPGARVTYTVTVHNIGAADYLAAAPGPDRTGVGPASWTDDLTAVLDDARYLGNAQTNAGAVGYAPPVLSWTGPVAAGESAVTVYSVEVNNPTTGDKTLLNTVTGPDSACPCPVRTEVDPTADPDLAGTGAAVLWYLVIALGLLAAGGGFFLIPVLRRRRRREEGTVRS